MTKDAYAKKWVKAIKDAYPDEDKLTAIVDKIYSDGHEDGISSTCELF